jgi:hypothetical protein
LAVSSAKRVGAKLNRLVRLLVTASRIEAAQTADLNVRTVNRLPRFVTDSELDSQIGLANPIDHLASVAEPHTAPKKEAHC